MWTDEEIRVARARFWKFDTSTDGLFKTVGNMLSVFLYDNDNLTDDDKLLLILRLERRSLREIAGLRARSFQSIERECQRLAVQLQERLFGLHYQFLVQTPSSTAVTLATQKGGGKKAEDKATELNAWARQAEIRAMEIRFLATVLGILRNRKGARPTTLRICTETDCGCTVFTRPIRYSEGMRINKTKYICRGCQKAYDGTAYRDLRTYGRLTFVEELVWRTWTTHFELIPQAGDYDNPHLPYDQDGQLVRS